MCQVKELEPLRRNLQNNLWRVINRESVEVFPFMDYLIDILIHRYKKITITSNKFLKAYRDKLKLEYAQMLDYIQYSIMDGNLIELESYIRKGINGNITQILDEFVENYEKSKKEYRNR